MAATTSGSVFLSYRRGDTAYVAGRLYDRLVDRYGAEHVFMDVEHVLLGADVGEVIDHGVADCAVLIAMIGKDWLSSIDADGRRRLDDPDDWIVVEIAAVLERGIPVVPVLVDGVDPPRRQDLPPASKRSRGGTPCVSAGTRSAPTSRH